LVYKYFLVTSNLLPLQKRGANIYAEFLGGSFTCDAYHVTEPHPDGKIYTFKVLFMNFKT
jgi:3-oxoacyl-(acyl-carrier-protein) synthase